MNIELFESLGDNCEFGFVQRHLGYDSGGLLRWAIARPLPLVQLIENSGKNLYLFENLTPSARDMVFDNETGIFFHSKMLSENQHFIETEEERRRIWNDEKAKVDYLLKKLFDQLEAGSKIFVYKTNNNVSEEEAILLADAIRARGPAKLLCVREAEDLMIGDVRHHSNNLYIATIDRFAPYERADHASFDVWMSILRNAEKSMKIPQ